MEWLNAETSTSLGITLQTYTTQLLLAVLIRLISWLYLSSKALMSARLEQSFPPTLIMPFENDFRSYSKMSSHMSCIVAPLWAQSLISFFKPLGVYSLNDGVTNKKGSFLMS